MTEPTPTNGVEATDSNKTYQDYLQSCCVVGQLFHAIEELDSQKRDLEKKLEVEQRRSKSLAHKLKEEKMKSQATPTPAVPKKEETPMKAEMN